MCLKRKQRPLLLGERCMLHLILKGGGGGEGGGVIQSQLLHHFADLYSHQNENHKIWYNGNINQR